MNSPLKQKRQVRSLCRQQFFATCRLSPGTQALLEKIKAQAERQSLVDQNLARRAKHHQLVLYLEELSANNKSHWR